VHQRIRVADHGADRRDLQLAVVEFADHVVDDDRDDGFQADEFGHLVRSDVQECFAFAQVGFIDTKLIGKAGRGVVHRQICSCWIPLAGNLQPQR